jgi:galactose mutarotase-like enzyme
MAEECVTRAQKENVLMRCGACSLQLLPHLGGKIASIRVHDRELLQAPLARLEPRTRTMSFDAADASGWDECLPSVAACRVRTQAGLVEIPDHGDLWRVEWQRQDTGTGPGDGDPRAGTKNGATRASPVSVTLRGECFSLPLTLERTLRLQQTDKGWQLDLEYRVKNTGPVPAPWSWAAHPLFAVDDGDTVQLPESIRSMRLEGSTAARLGRRGDTVPWPMAQVKSGGKADLSRLPGETAGVAEKLFAGPLGAGEDWCILHRRKAGLRIRFGFDAAATPYLGLWICAGGWPAGKGAKQMCVAIEPSTAPVDSLAETGSWSRTLDPGQACTWPMRVGLEIV